MNIQKLTKENIREIVKISSGTIKFGGIILMPFDTVYGFACDPRNDSAIEKIFAIKNRPESKTIGTAVCCFEELKNYAELNHFEFIKQRVPGPYTFILNSRLQTPDSRLSSFCYQNNTLGVRIPNSQLVLEIAKESGGIIAQTSANKSGQSNCTKIDEILNQFNKEELNQINLIIDSGDLGDQKPSELWNLAGNSPIKINR